MLFLSSYAPLFIILAIRNWDSRYVAGALLVLTLGSVVWLLVFLRQAAKLGSGVYRGRTRHVSRRRHRELHRQLFAPFLAIDFGRPADLLSLAVLLVVIALLYVHSNLIYVDPLLGAFGYHLAEIEEVSGKVSILLSRRPYVRPNSRLRVVLAGDLISMDAHVDQ